MIMVRKLKAIQNTDTATVVNTKTKINGRRLILATLQYVHHLPQGMISGFLSISLRWYSQGFRVTPHVKFVEGFSNPSGTPNSYF